MLLKFKIFTPQDLIWGNGDQKDLLMRLNF